MPGRLSRELVDAVLFDVDGTLVDSLRGVVLGLQETYSKFLNIEIGDAEIRALIGTPLKVQAGYFTKEPLPSQTLEEMEKFAVERFFSLEHLERDFEGAINGLVDCAESGLKTCLVTSKNGIELDRFMKRFSGKRSVMATVCASDVRHPKPDPESVLLACQKLGVEVSRSVMIGDSIFDVQSARAAGAYSVAVLYGAGDQKKLLEAGPDFVIETPLALRNWLAASFETRQCPAKN